MPRGGKRPGAGAPKGNFNALTRGRYSLQLQELARLLASIPEVRDLLFAYNRRQRRLERKAKRIAHGLLFQLLLQAPMSENDQNSVAPAFPGIKAKLAKFRETIEHNS